MVVLVETGGLGYRPGARGSAQPMGMEHHAEAPPGGRASAVGGEGVPGAADGLPDGGFHAVGPDFRNLRPSTGAREHREEHHQIALRRAGRPAPQSWIVPAPRTTTTTRFGAGAGNASSDPSAQRTVRLSIAAPAGIPKWARGSPELR